MHVLVREALDVPPKGARKIGQHPVPRESSESLGFALHGGRRRKLLGPPRAAEEPILAFSAPTFLYGTETPCQKIGHSFPSQLPPERTLKFRLALAAEATSVLDGAWGAGTPARAPPGLP